MDFVIFNVVIKKFHSPKKLNSIYIITCISLFPLSPTLNRKKKRKRKKKNYNMHVTGMCS
jgi:hypothetical protein